MLSKFSKLASFAGKKFSIIIAGEISASDIAYTGSLIGFQFGRVIPSMVGRDQQIPSSKGAGRTHLGITTQNLPVLNGLTYENMRALRKKLMEEKELFVTSVTDAVGACATYEEYARAVEQCPVDATKYWGIGIFGDAEIVNKYTQGLKLYAKQPKVANPTTSKKRLVSDSKEAADLPAMSFIFANDLTGGQLGNTGVILGVTLGKLYGDKIFGREIKDHGAEPSLGLPMIDLSILNGHALKNSKVRELREALHATPMLTVVDVTDDTSNTRDYGDYLRQAEARAVLNTNYQGLGISGPSELVAECTAGLGPYITSAEEKESNAKTAPKQSGASKWEKKRELNNVAPSHADTVAPAVGNGAGHSPGLASPAAASGTTGRSQLSDVSFVNSKPKPEAKSEDIEKFRQKIMPLFEQADKQADTLAGKKKLTLIFSDMASAKRCQGLLSGMGIKHFFDEKLPRNIIQVTKDERITYQIVFTKDEYNWIVNDSRAFDQLVNEPRNGEVVGAGAVPAAAPM